MMIAEARDLYLKYQGRQHALIEKEMQARGWPFYRELLYGRRRSGRIEKGWPELYEWKKLLPPKAPARKPTTMAAGTREFADWLNATFPEWTWTWRFQRYLYHKLHAVTEGKCKRLMIFMPPRHGKSETVTVRYTAWRLLRDPKLNVILGSYNQRLADRFSRKIKRIFTAETQRRRGKEEIRPQIHTDKHRSRESFSSISVHPCPSVAKTSSRRLGVSAVGNLLNSASEWETESGGVVRSVGVGGGIAGFGAGLIVIDDPVRNRADAESETYREKVWDWFNDDIYTRLEPNAAIILIQTRWHEDDLAGRLLKEQEDGGEKWEVVKLPALAEVNFTAETQRRRGKEEIRPQIHTDKHRCKQRNSSAAKDSPCLCASVVKNDLDPLRRKPGQALCPKRYSVAALEKIRKKLGSYSFSALYQQDPVPATGGRFKREWFRNIVDTVPENLRWKRGYDLAISTKTSADYTASFRCAFDRQGNLFIADGFRKRIEYPEQRRYIIDRMNSEPGTEHGIESAMHGKAVVQELRREPCDSAVCVSRGAC